MPNHQLPPGSHLQQWGYLFTQSEQVEHQQTEQTQDHGYEHEQLETMRPPLSPAEMFAYQYDNAKKIADAQDGATSPTYWSAEQYQGLPSAPAVSASASSWSTHNGFQMYNQGSPLALVGSSSFGSPTLGYSYAHSHSNLYMQPTTLAYGCAHGYVDAYGFPIGAAHTPLSTSIATTAGSASYSPEITTGPALISTPALTVVSSTSSLASALTPTSYSGSGTTRQLEQVADLAAVYENEQGSVYNNASYEYGYGHRFGFGYEQYDLGAGADADEDEDAAFTSYTAYEEGTSVTSTSTDSSTPAGTGAAHATPQLLALTLEAKVPQVAELPAATQAQVREVVPAVSLPIDHLPYGLPYIIGGAETTSQDTAAPYTYAPAPDIEESAPVSATVNEVSARHPGAFGPYGDIPATPSALGLREADKSFTKNGVDDDGEGEGAAAAAALMPTSSHSHGTTVTFPRRFVTIRPLPPPCVHGGIDIRPDINSEDEYVVPSQGKGRATGKGKGQTEGSHRLRERQRKKHAAKAAVVRQFQARTQSHGPMDEGKGGGEDEGEGRGEESHASGSSSGSRTRARARRGSKKQPFLACFFCRGRKIACCPPPPDSEDRTCNQCARRNLPCEYPLKSRRGKRRTAAAEPKKE